MLLLLLLQIKLHTNLSAEEYKRIGDEFNSPLFRMTMDNFNNYHNEYCHAGLWSYVLDLGKGTMKSCYCKKVTKKGTKIVQGHLYNFENNKKRNTSSARMCKNKHASNAIL